MRLLLTSILVLALSGCATWKPVPVEPKIVVKQEYIIRIPPAELMQFPPEVKDVDVDHATQADIANWIVDKESQTDAFKAKLQAIAKFLVDEKAKLDDQAAGTSK